MSPEEIYAIVLPSIFGILALLRLLKTIYTKFEQYGTRAARYIASWNVVVETRWTGRVRWSSILLQIFLIAVSVFLALFQLVGAKGVGRNAGQVGMVLMLPFFLGPHISYVADICGVSLSAMRSIHAAGTLAAAIMIGLHSLALKPGSSSLGTYLKAQIFAAVATLNLVILILLCTVHPLRRIWYEFFLRSHQILALGYLLGTCVHVWPRGSFVRFYSLGCVCCFSFTLVAQVADVLLRNGCFRRGFTWADISKTKAAVVITLRCSTEIKVRKGQHINIWIPSLRISALSWLQSHPFYIVFASHQEGGTQLELIVEPHRGWTSKLAVVAAPSDRTGAITDVPNVKKSSRPSYLTFFSGPHGQSIDLSGFGLVILAATGWGLPALISYLQDLIRSFNDGTANVRRIRLVWQLDRIGDGAYALTWLNRAMNTDKLDNGYIVGIQVYYGNSKIDPDEKKPGVRLEFLEGEPGWDGIVDQEASRIMTTAQPLNWQESSSSALTEKSALEQESQVKEVLDRQTPKQMTPAQPLDGQKGSDSALAQLSAFEPKHRAAAIMISAKSDVRRKLREKCRNTYFKVFELDGKIV